MDAHVSEFGRDPNGASQELPMAPVPVWGKVSVKPDHMKKKRFKSPADAMTGREYTDKVELPALAQADWPLDKGRAETLSTLYSETCAGWRALTEVRFKLLGFLPAASVAAIVAVLDRTRLERGGISLLGITVVGALWLYEKRNTKLYDDLVGRGRRIEAEMGIHTGNFRGRPESSGLVEHDVAIRLIYGASAVAWIVTGLSSLS